MKLLEITPKGNYIYDGRKYIMDWFWGYYKLLKLSRMRVSISDFYKELPPKIKKQIVRKKSSAIKIRGTKLKYVVIDEVVPHKSD